MLQRNILLKNFNSNHTSRVLFAMSDRPVGTKLNLDRCPILSGGSSVLGSPRASKGTQSPFNRDIVESKNCEIKVWVSSYN